MQLNVRLAGVVWWARVPVQRLGSGWGTIMMKKINHKDLKKINKNGSSHLPSPQSNTAFLCPAPTEHASTYQRCRAVQSTAYPGSAVQSGHGLKLHLLRQGAIGESTSVLQSKLSRGIRAPSKDLIVATPSC